MAGPHHNHINIEHDNITCAKSATVLKKRELQQQKIYHPSIWIKISIVHIKFSSWIYKILSQENKGTMKLLENSGIEAINNLLCLETGDSKIIGRYEISSF